jgi:DNA-binding response OmpR family regulator
MADPRVLVVDDDVRLTAMLAEWLGRHGLAVASAPDLAAGRRALAASPPDVLVLDGMLPDGDGLDLLREVRASSSLPIVLLTARGDDVDRIVGLELGADDYLPKPFNPRELLARLRAVLRRAQPVTPPDRIRFGAVEIDRAARSVRVEGRPIVITAFQYRLLIALTDRPGRVQTREELLSRVHGEALAVTERTIDVHVSRLRTALGDVDAHLIQTVRGAGYVFAGRAT